MKYITTSTHPELKEGIKLDIVDKQPSCLYSRNGIYIEVDIKSGLEKGYIKEVLTKEFTKDDMIALLDFYTQPDSTNDNNIRVFEAYLNEKQ